MFSSHERSEADRETATTRLGEDPPANVDLVEEEPRTERPPRRGCLHGHTKEGSTLRLCPEREFVTVPTVTPTVTPTMAAREQRQNKGLTTAKIFSLSDISANGNIFYVSNQPLILC
jgi:hypothetical protein